MSSDHWELAEKAHEQGDLASARVHYREYLKEFPETAEAWFNLGLIASEQKNFDSAIENFREAIRLEASNPAGYEGLGNALSDMERYSEAIEVFRQGALQDPSDLDFQIAEGRCLRLAMRFPEAVDYLLRLLDAEPNSTDAICELALTYNELGQYEESLRWSDKGLEFDPNDAYLYYNGANCLWQLGYDKASLGYYQEAVRLDPELRGAKEELAERLPLLEDTVDEKPAKTLWPLAGEIEEVASLRKLLGDLLTNQNMVQVFRGTSGDRIVGHVAGLGKELAILQLADDNMMQFDGYQTIRIGDITAIDDRSGDFIQRIFQIRGLRTSPVPQIPADRWQDLIPAISELFDLVSIVDYRRAPGCMSIGEILSCGSERVAIRTLDVQARWAETQELNLVDVTEVGFGSSYMAALLEVARAEQAMSDADKG